MIFALLLAATPPVTYEAAADHTEAPAAIATYPVWTSGELQISLIELREITPTATRYFLVRAGEKTFFIHGGQDSLLFALKENGRVTSLVLAHPWREGESMADPSKYRFAEFDLSGKLSAEKSSTKRYRGLIGDASDAKEGEQLRAEIAALYGKSATLVFGWH